MKPDSKAVLWQNVATLMKARYGKENLTKLAQDAKIGPGTASRIKAQETSVGLDVVESIAAVFKMEAWQLLVPEIDPSKPPRLHEGADAWPFAGVEARRVRRLTPDRLAKIEGYIDNVLEDSEAAEALAPGNRSAA